MGKQQMFGACWSKHWHAGVKGLCAQVFELSTMKMSVACGSLQVWDLATQNLCGIMGNESEAGMVVTWLQSGNLPTMKWSKTVEWACACCDKNWRINKFPIKKNKEKSDYHDTW